jgi:hypothetical protein
MMRFYNQPHKFYCGFDLHARSMYLRIRDAGGAVVLRQNFVADKLSALLRGGNFPLAYVYPKGLRETRDLLRRRSHFVRQRALLVTHVQNTNSQYNLPVFGKKLVSPPTARSSTSPSVSPIRACGCRSRPTWPHRSVRRTHAELELYLERHAKKMTRRA